MSGPLYGNGKRDACEAEVVRALQAAGATVQPLSGKDVPDLLVGVKGRTLLIEVKTGKAKLRPGQLRWHSAWRGEKPVVIRSAKEALQLMAQIGCVGGGTWQAVEDAESERRPFYEEIGRTK